DGRGATLYPNRVLNADEALFDVNFPNYDSIVGMQNGNELIVKDLHLAGSFSGNARGRPSAIIDTEKMRAGFRWTGGQISSTHANTEARNLTVGSFQVGFDFRAWQFNRAYNLYAGGCEIGHLVRNNPRGGGGTDTSYDLPKINSCDIGMMFLNESASGFSDLLGGGILPMLNNDIRGALFHQPNFSAIQVCSYETTAYNQVQLMGGKISEYMVGNTGWDDSRSGDTKAFVIGAATNPVPTGPYSGAVRAQKTLTLYSATYGVQAGLLIVKGVSCDDGATTRVYWLGSNGARIDSHDCRGGGNTSQVLCHSTDPTGNAQINFYGSCGYPGFAEAVGRRPDSIVVTRASPQISFFLQMFGRRGRRIVDGSLIGASATAGPSKLGRNIAGGVSRVTPAVIANNLQGTSAVTTRAASTSSYAAASNAAWGHDATVIEFRTMQTCGTYGARSGARLNLADWQNSNRCVAILGVRNPTASPLKVQIEFSTGYSSLHFCGPIDRPFYYTLQPGIIYDLVAFAGTNNQAKHFLISPWQNDSASNQNFDIEVSEPEYIEGEQELLDAVFHLGLRGSISGTSGP
ncbi:MAG: hypothetical protein ACK51Q_08460, partial [Betaproteobacteria bacterium]